MGRYSASSSVSSDLAAAAGTGPPGIKSGAVGSRVPPSASSSRVTTLGNTGNGDVGTPTGSDPSQALGTKVGESFSSLKMFTSTVVKSFSLSTGLFQAASSNDQENNSATTTSKTTVRYQGTKGVTSPTGGSAVGGSGSGATAIQHRPLPRQQSNVVSDMVSDFR